MRVAIGQTSGGMRRTNQRPVFRSYDHSGPMREEEGKLFYIPCRNMITMVAGSARRYIEESYSQEVNDEFIIPLILK